ncbi:hypothetical protein RND81_08G192900 [Saponaria officinalis]|uniref:(S)-ureidoglycine aminohydrolase cupin domain-containing protein n=1 Tax=Saponaria officinalis TaxID=3572 RepID=A0AAW1JB19_SAPOF
MGILGLTITIQNSIKISPSSLYSSNNKHNFYLNQHQIQFPAVNSISGLKFVKVKSNKVGNFFTVKASIEGSKMSTTIEKLGVRVEQNPTESTLSELGVLQWPKWGCPPSKFPWTYEAKETCYLLQGKVKVYPDGSSEPVEIGAGDLVVFPKGMKCTWDVSEAVDKHYKFE